MSQFFSILIALLIVGLFIAFWSFLWLLGTTLNHLYRLWENIP